MQDFKVTLECHRASPAGSVRGIEARVARGANGTLAVGYAVSGELAGVRLPGRRAHGSAEPLWAHTCCEIFIARRGLSSYHEFNFAPSGEWAAHAFERYREGGPLANAELEPRMTVRTSPDTLELDVLIPLQRLLPGHAGAPLALGLSCVVEALDGALSYWALAHPAGKPDFHHPCAFALELDELRN